MLFRNLNRSFEYLFLIFSKAFISISLGSGRMAFGSLFRKAIFSSTDLLSALNPFLGLIVMSSVTGPRLSNTEITVARYVINIFAVSILTVHHGQLPHFAKPSSSRMCITKYTMDWKSIGLRQ